MKDSLFRFSPILSIEVLITVFIVITIALLWIEIQRKGALKTVRIFSISALLVCLFFLFLKPSFRTTLAQSNIILLTPGYNPETVDSLINRQPSLKVIHAPDANEYKNSDALLTYHQLYTLADNITVVVGEGIPGHALELFNHKNYTFLPARYPEGIVGLYLNNAYYENKPGAVEGVLNCLNKNCKIVLHSPGGKSDSAIFNDTGKHDFSLKFTPKQAGKFLYKITTIIGEKIQEEVVPIQVQDKESLNILMLQQYPTFETQYLKQWLSSRHKLIIRSQISTEKFRYEFINQPERKVNVITRDLLNEIDLVIVNADALQALSNAEFINLKKEISDGLGLLVMLNQTSLTKRLQDIGKQSFLPDKKDTVTVWMSNKKAVIQTLPVNLEESNLIPVIKKGKKIISGYHYTGLGKIALSTAQNTYSFSLSGDSVTYNSLWTDLIEKTSRTRNKMPAVKITSRPPYYTDDPIDIEVIGEAAINLNDSIHIPVCEDKKIEGLYRARIWPKQTGWQHIITNDSISVNFYVSDTKDWPTLRSGKTIDQNKDFNASSDLNNTSKVVYKPVSKLILIVIIFICAGILWVLPKLFSQTNFIRNE